MRSAQPLTLHETAILRDVMSLHDETALGIALIVDDKGELAYTVTDGDVRRAVLRGFTADSPIRDAITPRADGPVVATADTEASELIRLMGSLHIRHIPITDGNRVPIGVVAIDDLMGVSLPPVGAVVMAGGKGRRLLPLTTETPKPMLPVGDKPMLEHVIGGLREAGVTEVCITTHHKAEAISTYFGNGSKHGVHITYLHEEVPMGTAGSLSKLRNASSTLLVVNADILTDLDYRAMIRFHHEKNSDFTIAVNQYEIAVPYGVVEVDDFRVVGVSEKPRLRYPVNAGMYLVQPGTLELISPGESLDAPELVRMAIAAGMRVLAFPLFEYWLDIGHHADYARASQEWKNHQTRQTSPPE